MMKTSKRILSLLLAMVMIFSMLPAGVVSAATTRRVEVDTALELKNAVNSNAQDGDVIVLTANITTDNKTAGNVLFQLSVDNDITLDLNGYTLTYNFQTHNIVPINVISGGKLTIQDSSAAKTGAIKGKIVSAGAYAHLLRSQGGELVINGGNISVVNPDNVEFTAQIHVVMTTNNSLTTINGGSFTAYGRGYAVETSGQETAVCKIYGGTFGDNHKLLQCLAGGRKIVSSNGTYTVQSVDPSATSDISGVFSVGYGREDITPSETVPMAGYGNTGMRPSQGVDSKLYTTCIAFTDADGNTVLLFHNDLIKSAQEVTERARLAVSLATGIAYDNVLVAATHTHSGPDVGYTGYGNGQIVRYNQMLVEKMVEAAITAMRDRKSAEVYTSSIECEGLNFVRHYLLADGSYAGDHFGDFSRAEAIAHTVEADAEMQLVKFAQSGGKDIVLANWQVHPHGIGSDNQLISSDLVGLMRDKVEKELDCSFIYFTGASGNVNSTSKISGENIYTYTERGNKMGEYAVTAAKSFEQVNAGAVQLVRESFTGTADKPDESLYEVALLVKQKWEATDDSAAAMALVPAGVDIHSVHHASSIVNKHEYEGETITMDEIYAFSIGDVAFVTAPYEMFTEHGASIKAFSPYAMTIVATCANNAYGYMPSEKFYQIGSYEVDVSSFASGTGEQLVGHYLGMLNELKGMQDDTIYVSTAQQLHDALQAGGKVALLGDIDYVCANIVDAAATNESAGIINISGTAVLDMGGKTITYTPDGSANKFINMTNNSNLTVTGNGKIYHKLVSSGVNGGTFRVATGTLTIENGTFERVFDGVSAESSKLCIIWNGGSGIVNVLGGKFYNASNRVIYTVTGATVQGGTFNADPTNYGLAEGCTVQTSKVDNVTWYTVINNTPCANGHTWAAATCKAPKTCTVCGITEGTALAHSYADATCTAPKTCTACGATAGDPAGHSYADATCEKPQTCVNCGATTGSALGHDMTEATCTAPAKCTICGVTTGSALGHSMTDATCTAPATCTRCGTIGASARGHKWQDATCQAPKTCSTCGKTEGEKTEHSYVDGACQYCGAENPVIAGGECGDNLTWTLTENGTLTISGTGNMWNWSSVSRAPWDSYRSQIRYVTIEEGVTDIGKCAFYECTSLQSVEIPDSVTCIGNTAFFGCGSLQSVEIPDSVTTIGFQAFCGCSSLQSVVIPNGVTTIDGHAFRICTSLQSVKIGNSVTSIGSYAFYNCTSLSNVIYCGTEEQWDAITIEDNNDYLMNVQRQYHSYVDGACEYCGDVKAPEYPTGTFEKLTKTLSLTDVIFINQRVRITGFEGIDLSAKGGLLSWIGTEMSVEEAIVGAEGITNISGLIYDVNNARYAQQTTGIFSNQYGKTVYMRFYVEVADGVYAYSDIYEDSVLAYCTTVLEKSSNVNQKNTCAALLYYGAAAQVKFDGATEGLISDYVPEGYEFTYDESLIDATKEAPAATFESTVSITKWTKSLSLTQAVFINYYAATTQTAGAKLLIWKEDATSLDPANAAYEAEMTWDATRGRYFAQSCEVYSSQLSNTLYACVEFTDAEGNVTYSDIDVYNPETYADTVIKNSGDAKMVDLCKKLVIYGEMARVQFAG